MTNHNAEGGNRRFERNALRIWCGVPEEDVILIKELGILVLLGYVITRERRLGEVQQ